jgi:hypothetical protein
MAQHDYNIANQSFPSFRTDLNNALSAIQTCNSGTSRPTGAVAGQIWLDTTSATTPTLKYYDGADDISLATLDHSANTVNWLDSNVSVTGLTTTATGTVLTLSDSSLTSSVNLILQNQKEIRFSETTANGVNYVGFKAPASLSADKIWVLPSADGTAGQFLKTDGAGNLSFDSLSFATPLAVIGNATAGSEIRLPEDTDNGSNYVAIKAPDTLASNLTLTLPSADGTSGQVLQTNGSGVLSFSSSGGKFESALFHVRDEKANNTSPNSATAGSFVKRDLNTVMTNEISGASLSSSQITLPSGTYYIYASAPAYYCNRHKIKLRNTTDSSDTLIGTSEISIQAGEVNCRSFISGRFTISAQKVFEIQHRIQTNGNANNFGYPSNFSVVEVYTDVQIWKVA